MTTIKFILLFLNTLHLSFGYEKTLQQVHVIFRHGDRTPLQFAPNDRYKNLSQYWPEGLGQLTKRGQESEYFLGYWLRSRYNNFTHPVYRKDEVHVLSTDLDRTLMSAQCVLASYFYPPEADRIAESVPWLPVPVHNVNKDTDNILNVDHACPRIEEEWHKLVGKPIMQDFLHQHQELFSLLSNFTGQKIRTLMDVALLYDALFIEKLKGLRQPEWVQTYWDEMEQVSSFKLKMDTYTNELKMLRSGPLLKEITSHMEEKSEHKTNMKLYMYSAHDFIIANLLNTIGAFNGKQPPYGSASIIELHRINETSYTKLFYHNDTSRKEPYQLSIEGCSDMCPLAQWQKVLIDKMPGNWTHECHLNTSEIKIEKTNSETGLNYWKIIMLVVFSVVFVFIIGSIIMKIYRTRRYNALVRSYLQQPATYGSLPNFQEY